MAEVEGLKKFSSFDEYYVSLAKQVASRNGIDASELTVEHLEKREPFTWEELTRQFATQTPLEQMVQSAKGEM